MTGDDEAVDDQVEPVRRRVIAPRLWLLPIISLGLVAILAIVLVAVFDRDGGDGTAALPADTGADYDRYVDLVDASGAVEVAVPAAWGETDRGETDVLASVAAAADLEAALTGSEAAGVVLTVTPEPLRDADQVLDRLVATGCRDRGRDDYDDGVHRGRFRHLEGCGPVESSVWVVAAAPDDGSYTVVISLQAVEPKDETAARRLLDSLTVDAEAVPRG